MCIKNVHYINVWIKECYKWFELLILKPNHIIPCVAFLRDKVIIIYDVLNYLKFCKVTNFIKTKTVDF